MQQYYWLAANYIGNISSLLKWTWELRPFIFLNSHQYTIACEWFVKQNINFFGRFISRVCVRVCNRAQCLKYLKRFLKAFDVTLKYINSFTDYFYRQSKKQGGTIVNDIFSYPFPEITFLMHNAHRTGLDMVRRAKQNVSMIEG